MVIDSTSSLSRLCRVTRLWTIRGIAFSLLSASLIPGVTQAQQQEEPGNLPPLEVKETPKGTDKEKTVDTTVSEDEEDTEDEETAEGIKLWQKGQDALLDGKSHEAITYFQRSLKKSPLLARNYLSLAAAYAEQGEDELEALQLELYLKLEPEHHLIRKHLADLRIRLNQHKEAFDILEKFVADIQEITALACDHLVVTHTKMAKLAEKEEDLYGSHLNRGLGLFRMALQQEAMEDSDKKDVERLLTRAAGELTQARLARAREARPNLYLYEIWKHMGESQQAIASLHKAEETAPYSYLTPTEQQMLKIALQELDKRRDK